MCGSPGTRDYGRKVPEAGGEKEGEARGAAILRDREGGERVRGQEKGRTDCSPKRGGVKPPRRGEKKYLRGLNKEKKEAVIGEVRSHGDSTETPPSMRDQVRLMQSLSKENQKRIAESTRHR